MRKWLMIFLQSHRLRDFATKVEYIAYTHCSFFYKHVLLPLRAWCKSRMLQYYVEAATPAVLGDNRLLWENNSAEIEDVQPFISVIVPAYNHAPYLVERLDSIYGQSYRNFEVILLDDCSTDGSRDILLEYRDKYPDRTKVCFNEHNGKNVFKQWEKGMSMAKGNYIWIAESDDYCQTDFLAKMISAFADETVLLAFCRTDFIQKGKKICDTEAYLADMIGFDWSQSFVATAYNLVREAWAVKNIIPNVSGVIFKKREGFPAELEEVWRGMQLCGDWAFYLDTVKGGTVAYVHDTTDYYRVHANSTSLKIQKDAAYYVEHERIACFIARNYKVADSMHEEHYNQLKKHFFSYFGGTDVQQLDQWFDREKIRKAAQDRKPNVLMGVFSMQSGGGETFPIILANELRGQGVPVTVCDFQMDRYEIGVRNMIRKDVAYLSLKDVVDLRYIFEQFGIDVVHSHHASVDEVLSHFVERGVSKVHHVITLHGMYETIDELGIISLLKKVEKSCSAFVYIADKNLKPFQAHHWNVDDRFYKISNGLANMVVHPIQREVLHIAEDAFVLCVVSRAIPEKGWEKAVAAVTQAREVCGRDIHLLLLGDGIMYSKLQGRVPEYIHLLGFQPNVRDYFAMSDMGLLPSEFKGESFPLVIIECLFSGRPMIATDLGESRNQLLSSDGNMAGMVVPVHDGKFQVDDLAAAIVQAAREKAVYDNCLEYVAEVSKKFYIETVAQEYRRVYHEVVSSADA